MANMTAFSKKTRYHIYSRTTICIDTDPSLF